MRAIPIGDEWIEENDDLVVRSPFDGHEIDRVPAGRSPVPRRDVYGLAAMLGRIGLLSLHAKAPSAASVPPGWSRA